MLDGTSDDIQQAGAAPNIVLFFDDRSNLTYLHTVMGHLALVVKEDGRGESLAGLFLLLFDHSVEATDGISLQPLHGATAVQDENKLRQILLYEKSPYAVLFGLRAQYRGNLS